ncbi:MAG: asparaginase domain-containing protein [Pseudomonadota bacterium]
MSFQFKLSDFDDYSFDEGRFNTPSVKNFIDQSGFKNNENTLALVGCGGTISSAYSPSNENISPTHFSPINDILKDLDTAFGVAENQTSFISLLNKDSRDITIEDIIFVMDFLNGIQNNRIVLTVGTYGLPLVTQILDRCIEKDRAKLICVTGSMLISSIKENDADFNGGGAITSLNALSHLSSSINESIVYTAFHGKVYKPHECENLELHLESHKDVEFYRGQRLAKSNA